MARRDASWAIAAVQAVLLHEMKAVSTRLCAPTASHSVLLPRVLMRMQRAPGAARPRSPVRRRRVLV